MERPRYESLDGLRGIAALSVCFFHFFCAYVPHLIPGQTTSVWWGSDTPLAVLYNGGFAVSVFFVLSGFVVSNSAAKRHLPVLFNLIQRYFRLAIPMLGGTLFGWALLALWPHTVAELKAANDHPWLAFVYDGNDPGFFWAVKNALFGVFKNGGSGFDNVLWTMPIELIGSFGIYLLYSLVPLKWRVPTLIAVGLLCVVPLYQPEYTAFALGALLREATMANRLSSRLVWPALAFALVFGAMMPCYSHRLGIPPLPGTFALGAPHKVWHVLAATAVLYAVLECPALKLILSTCPARFLGDISFGLYLVHVPMLYTVFVPIYLTVQGSFLGLTALLILFLLTSLILAFAFTLLIDRPTINLIRQAQQTITNRRNPQLR